MADGQWVDVHVTAAILRDVRMSAGGILHAAYDDSMCMWLQLF
jgi:hypothetical protein